MLRAMRRSPTRLLFAAVALVAVVGCGPRRPPPPPFIRTTVATLPFDNASASIDAPKIFRAQFHPMIPRKGYLLQPLQQTDAVLQEMGIQLGGQIKGVDPKELRAKLGADLAVWGTVRQSSSMVTGIYNRRTVEVEVMLTDLRSGEVIWKETRKVVTDSAANVGGKAGLANFVAGAVDGLARADLTKEHQNVAAQLANAMPWCPREPPPPPAPSP